jgi:hypothetical protein
MEFVFFVFVFEIQKISDCWEETGSVAMKLSGTACATVWCRTALS